MNEQEAPRRKPGRPPKVKPERRIPRYDNAGDHARAMQLYRAFTITLQAINPNVSKVDAAADELIAFINRCRGL